ncbi:MAG: hypothetical protein ACRDU4_06910 [Mycobacterium sp.]
MTPRTKGNRRGRNSKLPLRVVHAFRRPLAADVYGVIPPIDVVVQRKEIRL